MMCHGVVQIGICGYQKGACHLERHASALRDWLSAVLLILLPWKLTLDRWRRGHRGLYFFLFQIECLNPFPSLHPSEPGFPGNRIWDATLQELRAQALPRWAPKAALQKPVQAAVPWTSRRTGLELPRRFENIQAFLISESSHSFRQLVRLARSPSQLTPQQHEAPSCGSDYLLMYLLKHCDYFKFLF